MKDEASSQATLAVLIDADNARPSIVDGLLSEVAKYGIASVKRIYGDWTTPQLGGWKAVLLEHSIHPIQQFRYTTGKNATDSSMIIDAMDLLYTDASTASAWSRATATSPAWPRASARRACGSTASARTRRRAPSSRPATSSSTPRSWSPPVRRRRWRRRPPVICAATRAWSTSSARRSMPPQTTTAGLSWGPSVSTSPTRCPTFDPRNYGFKKLSELARNIGVFEVKRRAQNVVIRDQRGH